MTVLSTLYSQEGHMNTKKNEHNSKSFNQATGGVVGV